MMVDVVFAPTVPEGPNVVLLTIIAPPTPYLYTHQNVLYERSSASCTALPLDQALQRKLRREFEYKELQRNSLKTIKLQMSTKFSFSIDIHHNRIGEIHHKVELVTELKPREYTLTEASRGTLVLTDEDVEFLTQEACLVVCQTKKRKRNSIEEQANKKRKITEMFSHESESAPGDEEKDEKVPEHISETDKVKPKSLFSSILELFKTS